MIIYVLLLSFGFAVVRIIGTGRWDNRCVNIVPRIVETTTKAVNGRFPFFFSIENRQTVSDRKPNNNDDRWANTIIVRVRSCRGPAPRPRIGKESPHASRLRLVYALSIMYNFQKIMIIRLWIHLPVTTTTTTTTTTTIPSFPLPRFTAIYFSIRSVSRRRH